MKKEELVAMGLSEEHALKVTEAWAESLKGFIPKTRFDEVNEQLKTANTTIETLKTENQGNADLQNQVKQYRDKVAELEAAGELARKEYALKNVLQKAGVLDADYLIYKQGGVDKFTFDKEGKPVGVDDVVKPFKETSPHLFKPEPGADYKPAAGTSPAAANPFAKDSFNLTEQGRLLRDNPEQARQLAASAGVTISV